VQFPGDGGEREREHLKIHPVDGEGDEDADDDEEAGSVQAI